MASVAKYIREPDQLDPHPIHQTPSAIRSPLSCSSPSELKANLPAQTPFCQLCKHLEHLDQELNRLAAVDLISSPSHYDDELNPGIRQHRHNVDRPTRLRRSVAIPYSRNIFHGRFDNITAQPTFQWVERIMLAIASFQDTPFNLSWICMMPLANRISCVCYIDSRLSPGLTLNLSSNNPFRNRAASPAALPDGQRSPFDPLPPRPVSRNPFLDASATEDIFAQRVHSPDKMAFPTSAAPQRAALTGNAAELFVCHPIGSINKCSAPD